MLIANNRSVVILVDVQEKLTPLIHQNDTMIQQQKWVLELSNALNIPVIVSEQYPKGLGKTLPELAAVAEQNAHYFYFDKCDFSCATSDALTMQLKQLKRDQIILIGIETHVCVLQTALQLVEQTYNVAVIEDAVSSRNPNDKKLALKRLRQHGVEILSSEMLLFESLRTSQHEQFRDISKRFLKSTSA